MRMMFAQERRKPDGFNLCWSLSWMLVLVLITSNEPCSWHAHAFYTSTKLFRRTFHEASLLVVLSAKSPHRRRPNVVKPGVSAKSSTRKAKPSSLPEKLQRVKQNRKTKRRNTFNVMFERLKAYQEQHGHCFVSSEDEDQELYKWTRSIRKNYKYQFTNTVRDRSDEQQKQKRKAKGNTTRRPMLSESKRQKLQSLNFVWNVQEAVWEQRYRELKDFYDIHGHDSGVSAVYSYDPALAIWLQNQRRDYRFWLQDLPSLLTEERLEALEELGVIDDYKTQQEAWSQHYQYLVEYHQKYGHCNVPQHYLHPVTMNVLDENQQTEKRHTTFALGRWCSNQRAAKRRWDAMRKIQEEHEKQQQESKTLKKPKKSHTGSQAMKVLSSHSSRAYVNAERIRLLEALDFSWNTKETRWFYMLGRLREFHRQYGHLKISTKDAANKDLREWLITQRHHFQRRRFQQSSTMTEDRIHALTNSIPNFSWNAVTQDGPSAEDWSNLFSAMREKGIAPGMRPKQHWFEGVNPFAVEVKSEWTEQELIDLFHEGDGDEEDDDGDMNGFGAAPAADSNTGSGGVHFYVDMDNEALVEQDLVNQRGKTEATT